MGLGKFIICGCYRSGTTVVSNMNNNRSSMMNDAYQNFTANAQYLN